MGLPPWRYWNLTFDSLYLRRKSGISQVAPCSRVCKCQDVIEAGVSSCLLTAQTTQQWPFRL